MILAAGRGEHGENRNEEQGIVERSGRKARRQTNGQQHPEHQQSLSATDRPFETGSGS